MSTRSRNLTLEEIGRRAGVSRSTVSRVLNQHPDVRPAVRERVEQVIRETGYRPNQAARALVSSKTGLIGLVMLTDVDELFGDPYYSALVHGIQQGCAERGLIFSIFPVQSPEGRSDRLADPIAGGFVDGVIATAGPERDDLIAVLRDRAVPLVAVGHPHESDGLLRVDVDNRGGSAAAVQHLVEHGRRRIAYIGPSAEFRYGDERLDGYRDALVGAGRAVDEALVVLDEPTSDGGARAARAVLPERPDAIHAATDQMAAGVYAVLAERGLAIPDDVALVGFDGLPRGPRLEPGLTTVVQPVIEVGRAAVELLADADASEASPPIILPTELRLGGSCGAHPVA